MITVVETKRILCLNGHVVLELEECTDGFLNIKVSGEPKLVRLGVPDSKGTYFKFVVERK